MTEEHIRELEQKIADLKARWPAHAPRLSMLRELEDLEGQLEVTLRGQRDRPSDNAPPANNHQ